MRVGRIFFTRIYPCGLFAGNKEYQYWLVLRYLFPCNFRGASLIKKHIVAFETEQILKRHLLITAAKDVPLDWACWNQFMSQWGIRSDHDETHGVSLLSLS